MVRRSPANASTASTGALCGSSRPTNSTTGMPSGRGRGRASHAAGRPSAIMNRTSVAPSRRADAAVAEFATSVTVEFRSVSRLRLFMVSSGPANTVRNVSIGNWRPNWRQ